MSPIARRVLMALLLVAGAGFARLGVWQLSRLRERRARNLATEAAPTRTAGTADRDGGWDRHAR